MPIEYAADTAWPPADVELASPYYREWLAWWRNDTDELSKIYTTVVAPSLRRQGVRGLMTRFWSGVSTSNPRRLHVPAASDVSAISAGLLFADPPTLAIPDGAGTPAQDRLDEILNEAGIYAMLHEAAEKGSAAGGVYLRASVNVELADMPIGEALLPDCAIPEFYGPFLVAVTFYRVLSGDRSPVVRHLERHEMRGDRCVIEHAVFEGTATRLGKRASLADHPETMPFAVLVDDDSLIDVGTSVLDVVYVPNIKPHYDPLLGHLGRSDYAGAELELDALDKAWTSWMRDLDLGQARLIVPRQYVRRPTNEGDGGIFDAQQEIFTQVNAQLGNSESGQLSITQTQFAIRVEEHQRTTQELWRIILQRAGLDGNENRSEDSPAETATSVNSRAGRKRGTRAVKTRAWTPALRRFARVLQELDALYYGGRAVTAPVDVEWPDASAPDIETLARTIQLLDAAGAVSTRTKVTMLHPEWDDDQVSEEIAEIAGEAPPAPDTIDPADPGAPPADSQVVDEGVDNAPPEGLDSSGAPL